jgi:hypothetical protein
MNEWQVIVPRKVFEMQCNQIVPRILDKFGPTATIGEQLCGQTCIHAYSKDGRKFVVGIGYTPLEAWYNALKHSRTKAALAVRQVLVR